MPYKIFIDQGHNPMNPNAGAEYDGVREQDITFTVGAPSVRTAQRGPPVYCRTIPSGPHYPTGYYHSGKPSGPRTGRQALWGGFFHQSARQRRRECVGIRQRSFCLQPGKPGQLPGVPYFNGVTRQNGPE